MLERVRRGLPTLVRAVVEQATSGLAPRVRTGRSACPRCGRPARPQQERSRQILTRCGPVTLERPWYHRGRCHRGWSVVETTLAVGSRQRASAGLPGWLARLGTTTDYREAADLLDELTGLAVGPETIRRECGRVGTAIRVAEAAISDVAHPSWRASAVGVYRLWRDLGYAVGALLAGLLADLFGPVVAIAAVGLLTFASGLVVLVRKPETLHRPET